MSSSETPQSDHCCPEFARTGYAHTEICPAFDTHDRARRHPEPAPLSDRWAVERTGHYYGDGCPEHPVLVEGRPVYPTDPIIVPRTGRAPSPLVRITREIWEELRRAEIKFPDQHLPNGTPAHVERIGLEKALDQARRTANMYRKVCKTAAADGSLTWRHVLTEEFFEALAEHDPAALRAELLQVAAMAVRWVKDIDMGADRPTVIPPDPDGTPEPDSRERKLAAGIEATRARAKAAGVEPWSAQDPAVCDNEATCDIHGHEPTNPDHPFVPYADPNNPGGYRCGYAKSRTDASTFCWRPSADHGQGAYPPSPAQRREAEFLARAADRARKEP